MDWGALGKVLTNNNIPVFQPSSNYNNSNSDEDLKELAEYLKKLQIYHDKVLNNINNIFDNAIPHEPLSSSSSSSSNQQQQHLNDENDYWKKNSDDIEQMTINYNNDDIYGSKNYNEIKRGLGLTPAFILSGLAIIGIIMIAILIAYEKRKKKNSTRNYDYVSAPVVVTSSTHTPANTGVNYPVDEPIRGYQSTQPPYTANTTPYPMPQPTPVHTGVPYPINDGMPMPQAHGQYQAPQTGYQAPYPPAQNPQDVLPPSYDQVVGGSTGAPTTTPYNKQSPYNPHYAGN